MLGLSLTPTFFYGYFKQIDHNVPWWKSRVRMKHYFYRIKMLYWNIKGILFLFNLTTDEDDPIVDRLFTTIMYQEKALFVILIMSGFYIVVTDYMIFPVIDRIEKILNENLLFYFRFCDENFTIQNLRGKYSSFNKKTRKLFRNILRPNSKFLKLCGLYNVLKKIYYSSLISTFMNFIMGKLFVLNRFIFLKYELFLILYYFSYFRYFLWNSIYSFFSWFIFHKYFHIIWIICCCICNSKCISNINLCSILF